MKTYVKFTLAALALGWTLPVQAETLDVSSVTCEVAQALDADTLTMLIFFIDGYTGGEAGDPVFDAERLGKDIDKVSATCAADPSKTLMDAMKEALAG